MQSILNPHDRAVFNWSIPGQLMDQFAAAVVVINSLPFRGRIDRLPPSQLHWLLPLPIATGSLPAAAVGYDVAEPIESITSEKRHRLSPAKARVLSRGGTDVLHL
jgi:hypothetical protein